MGAEGKRAEAPAACLVYSKSVPGRCKQSILHFGPFVVDQILYVLKGDNVRFGLSRFTKAISSVLIITKLQRTFPVSGEGRSLGQLSRPSGSAELGKLLNIPLRNLIAQRGWGFGQGPQLRADNSKSEGEFALTTALEGKSILDTARLTTAYYIPDNILVALTKERQRIPRRGKSAIDLLSAPHVFISATHALYSEVDFVIHSPNVGIAADVTDANYP